MDDDTVNGLILLAISGVIGWFWFSLQQMQKDIREALMKANQAITTEEVRQMLYKSQESTHKDIEAVKEDTRQMAESVLKSISGLENRFDALMLHLMNKSSDK